MMKPLSIPLNVAVLHCASRVWPRGFDVADDAPNTFPELNREFLSRGRITVWSGGSERTIFGDPEVNYAFRAWHDFHHIKGSHAFTLDGEIDTCRDQCRDLIALYGFDTSKDMRKLVEIEVIGQAEFFDYWKKFPEDQVAFALYALENGINVAVRAFAGGKAKAA